MLVLFASVNSTLFWLSTMTWELLLFHSFHFSSRLVHMANYQNVEKYMKITELLPHGFPLKNNNSHGNNPWRNLFCLDLVPPLNQVLVFSINGIYSEQISRYCSCFHCRGFHLAPIFDWIDTLKIITEKNRIIYHR